MAAYPNYPSRRMAWDADGSVLLYYVGNNLPTTVGIAPPGPWLEANSAFRAETNDEDLVASINGFGLGGGTGAAHVCIIFPELREIDGVFDQWEGNGGISSYWQKASPDTTNGIDGAWTQDIVSGKSAPSAMQTLDRTDYRTNIQTTALSSMRAIRIFARSGGSNTYVGVDELHIFGEIAAGQTPDRLLFIDETSGLEFTTALDFEDVPRGSSEDREWRIKNNSATLDANTIQYTSEALFLGAASWFTHSLPAGSTYQGTQQITTLAPATTTGIIKTRRISPGTDAPDVYAARTYLNVDTWT